MGRYQKNAVPVLERVLEKPAEIDVWGRAERLADVAWAVEEMRKNREWNLYFPPGTLISPEKISRWNMIPLKYPVELEEQGIAGNVEKRRRNAGALLRRNNRSFACGSVIAPKQDQRNASPIWTESCQ